MDKTLSIRGFTLVELLVTVVLFAVVMSSALSILAVTVKNNYKAEKVMKIRRLGDYATNVIHRTIALANWVDIDNSSESVLVFTQANRKTYTITCDIDEKTLIINDGTSDVELINGVTSGTTITTCEFDGSCRDTASRRCIFRLNLTVDSDTSETFTSTTTYRNEVFD